MSEAVLAARAAGVTVVEPATPQDRSVNVNGIRLHYLDWGNPHLPPLLFLHGFAQQAHSWDFAALALRHKYHCIALDLRGHGDSAWSPTGEYGLGSFVSDTEAFVNGLGLRSLAVCGLSMGGRTAYTFAGQNPARVRALIVTEAAPESLEAGRRSVSDFTAPAEFDDFEHIVARVLAYNPRRTPEQVRGSLRNSVRQRPDGKWAWKWDPAVRSSRSSAPYEPKSQWEALSNVRCPALFVIGEQSDMISNRTVQRMLASVPDSRSVTIEKAGHLVAGDNPGAFNAAVLSFLEGLPV
ncbi:MAG: alpha/beta hydrolase [Dehalococcoidia bacterium]|nr:alpha/beta hydrolase [Dehalococcoidia bacterium]MSQ35033.1 alpha/beta hydrolase [Dehalococcoidia bacterium]